MDYRVLAYVAAVCLGTGIVFGLAPALHVSRTSNHDVLKDGGRGTAGTRRSRRFSAVMVVAELALTVVLLCGAGLMLRSFIALARVDTGIEVTGLMRMRLIVNQALASKFFPGEDPIGRRIRFVRRDDDDDSQAPDEGWRTIVGVSGRILQGPSLDAFRAEVVYLPFRQEAPRTASLLVRSALPPESVVAAVRGAVQAVDRDQPVFTVQTVDQLLREERSIYRIFAVLFGLLAAVALTLSSVGLYAVMAYAVTQRTQEIGVRVAIGAQRWQVSWLFLRSGLAQLAMGLVLGLPAALTMARITRLRLVEVEPTDPLTIVGITLLLCVVALAACLVPARRASRVDPVDALRAD